eukprot:Transcript_31805.p1 GENE.Transcript_31805~~Transcript_31805.p1  ORF type:complete len:332 (+),score=61.52 Transcript_31805:2-997(+)
MVVYDQNYAARPRDGGPAAPPPRPAAASAAAAAGGAAHAAASVARPAAASCSSVGSGGDDHAGSIGAAQSGETLAAEVAGAAAAAQVSEQWVRGSKAAKSDVRKGGPRAGRRLLVGLGRQRRPSGEGQLAQEDARGAAAAAFRRGAGGALGAILAGMESSPLFALLPPHLTCLGCAASSVSPIRPPASFAAAAAAQTTGQGEVKECAPTATRQPPRVLAAPTGGEGSGSSEAPRMPEGWLCVQHTSSSGHAYKRYKGPNGERAQSLKQVWAIHHKKAGGEERQQETTFGPAVVGTAAGKRQRVMPIAPPPGAESAAAPAGADEPEAKRRES